MSQTKLSMHLRLLRRSIPQLKNELAAKVLAVEAAKFHNENFQAQAWTENMRPWPPRQDMDDSRSLLVQSGRLRRTATTGRTRQNVVDFVMPIYGRVHNYGERAGRGGFNMPQRQFAGPATKLKARIKAKAKTIIDARLKGL
jgi:phage gpG-like protein